MPVLFAVIPVYDEPHTLAQCVANVMAVRLPPQWSLKVIVVDDASGSDTATVAVAAPLASSTTITCSDHCEGNFTAMTLATHNASVWGSS